jgi:hypothetical protein
MTFTESNTVEQMILDAVSSRRERRHRSARRGNNPLLAGSTIAEQIVAHRNHAASAR